MERKLNKVIVYVMRHSQLRNTPENKKKILQHKVGGLVSAKLGVSASAKFFHFAEA